MSYLKVLKTTKRYVSVKKTKNWRKTAVEAAAAA